MGVMDEEFLARFASVGSDVNIFDHALILSPEKISLGDRVRIDDFARIEGGSGITIGSDIHISSFSSIFGGGKVTMGSWTGLAQGAKLVTGGGHPWVEDLPHQPPPGDAHQRFRAEVTVGDYAFIGVNAIVLPNVVVEEGAVVAAGAVVTKDVPAWTIVAGTPAKPVKERERFIP
jgi:acetyltransferase-like isoleucine patch superfamily enzyme